VNYVITAAFIGTALELIRFSELFVYALKLSLAHSSAEKTAVRKVGRESCQILSFFKVTLVCLVLKVIFWYCLGGSD
jgi:hypothetical protein